MGSYVCNDCYNKIIKKCEFNSCTKDKFFLYKYEGELRELLLKYKFRDKSYLRDFFASSIIKNKKLCIFLNQYDIITPVPLHRKRKLERGYNQTEQILKVVFNTAEKVKPKYKIYEKRKSNILSLPQYAEPNFTDINNKLILQIYSKSQSSDKNKTLLLGYNKDILSKVKNIKPQSTKNGVERKINTQDAFKIKDKKAKELIKGKSIVIFDDIYTTGSTFNECKKVLLQAGAKNVGAFMIAKDM